MSHLVNKNFNKRLYNSLISFEYEEASKRLNRKKEVSEQQRMVAHIAFDGTISESRFEGSCHKSTASLLIRLLSHFKRFIGNPKVVEEIIDGLTFLKRISQACIRDKAPRISNKEVAETVKNRLCIEKKEVLLPGGTDKHAILYWFAPLNRTHCTLTLVNTGEGTGLHSARYKHGKEEICPYLVFTIPYKGFPGGWTNLIGALLRPITANKPIKDYNTESLYKELLPSLYPFLNTKDPRCTIFRESQRDGVCAWKCLLPFLQVKFNNDSLYQQFCLWIQAAQVCSLVKTRGLTPMGSVGIQIVAHNCRIKFETDIVDLKTSNAILKMLQEMRRVKRAPCPHAKDHVNTQDSSLITHEKNKIEKGSSSFLENLAKMIRGPEPSLPSKSPAKIHTFDELNFVNPHLGFHTQIQTLSTAAHQLVLHLDACSKKASQASHQLFYLFADFEKLVEEIDLSDDKFWLMFNKKSSIENENFILNVNSILKSYAVYNYLKNKESLSARNIFTLITLYILTFEALSRTNINKCINFNKYCIFDCVNMLKKMPFFQALDCSLAKKVEGIISYIENNKRKGKSELIFNGQISIKEGKKIQDAEYSFYYDLVRNSNNKELKKVIKTYLESNSSSIDAYDGNFVQRSTLDSTQKSAAILYLNHFLLRSKCLFTQAKLPHLGSFQQISIILSAMCLDRQHCQSLQTPIDLERYMLSFRQIINYIKAEIDDEQLKQETKETLEKLKIERKELEESRLQRIATTRELRQKVVELESSNSASKNQDLELEKDEVSIRNEAKKNHAEIIKNQIKLEEYFIEGLDSEIAYKKSRVEELSEKSSLLYEIPPPRKIARFYSGNSCLIMQWNAACYSKEVSSSNKKPTASEEWTLGSLRNQYPPFIDPSLTLLFLNKEGGATLFNRDGAFVSNLVGKSLVPFDDNSKYEDYQKIGEQNKAKKFFIQQLASASAERSLQASLLCSLGGEYTSLFKDRDVQLLFWLQLFKTPQNSRRGTIESLTTYIGEDPHLISSLQKFITKGYRYFLEALPDLDALLFFVRCATQAARNIDAAAIEPKKKTAFYEFIVELLGDSSWEKLQRRFVSDLAKIGVDTSLQASVRQLHLHKLDFLLYLSSKIAGAKRKQNLLSSMVVSWIFLNQTQPDPGKRLIFLEEAVARDVTRYFKAEKKKGITVDCHYMCKELKSLLPAIDASGLNRYAKLDALITLAAPSENHPTSSEITVYLVDGSLYVNGQACGIPDHDMKEGVNKIFQSENYKSLFGDQKFKFWLEKKSYCFEMHFDSPIGRCTISSLWKNIQVTTNKGEQYQYISRKEFQKKVEEAGLTWFPKDLLHGSYHYWITKESAKNNPGAIVMTCQSEPQLDRPLFILDKGHLADLSKRQERWITTTSQPNFATNFDSQGWHVLEFNPKSQEIVSLRLPRIFSVTGTELTFDYNRAKKHFEWGSNRKFAVSSDKLLLSKVDKLLLGMPHYLVLKHQEKSQVKVLIPLAEIDPKSVKTFGSRGHLKLDRQEKDKQDHFTRYYIEYVFEEGQDRLDRLVPQEMTGTLFLAFLSLHLGHQKRAFELINSDLSEVFSLSSDQVAWLKKIIKAPKVYKNYTPNNIALALHAFKWYMRHLVKTTLDFNENEKGFILDDCQPFFTRYLMVEGEVDPMYRLNRDDQEELLATYKDALGDRGKLNPQLNNLQLYFENKNLGVWEEPSHPLKGAFSPEITLPNYPFYDPSSSAKLSKANFTTIQNTYEGTFDDWWTFILDQVKTESMREKVRFVLAAELHLESSLQTNRTRLSEGELNFLVYVLKRVSVEELSQLAIFCKKNSSRALTMSAIVDEINSLSSSKAKVDPFAPSWGDSLFAALSWFFPSSASVPPKKVREGINLLDEVKQGFNRKKMLLRAFIFNTSYFKQTQPPSLPHFNMTWGNSFKGSDYRKCIKTGREEVNKAVQFAAHAMTKTPQFFPSTQKLAQLKNELKQLLDRTTNEATSCKNEALKLANSYTKSPSKVLVKELQLLERNRNVIVESDLIDLFLLGDRQAYLKMNPDLINNSSAKRPLFLQVFNETAKWLFAETQKQQVQRALDWIEKIHTLDNSNQQLNEASKKEREWACYQLGQIMSQDLTPFLEDTKEFPLRIKLIFSYLSLKLPRNAQLDVVQTAFTSLIAKKSSLVEMLMGGGKTSVLLVFFCYLAKLSGKLPLLLVDPSQYQVVAQSLSESLQTCFNQKTRPLVFDRKELTMKRLQWIVKILSRSKKEGTLILTTPHMIQLFDEMRFVLAYQYGQQGDNQDNQRIIDKKIKILNRILAFFEVAMVDEAHLGFTTKLDLNLPLGAKRPVKKEFAHLTMDVFKCLCTLNIGLKEGRQTLLTDKNWERIREDLANHLVENYPQIKAYIKKYPSEKSALIAFIKNVPVSRVKQSNPKFVQRIRSNPQSSLVQSICFARVLLSQILPSCFSKEFNKNFGRSRKEPGDV